MVEDPNWRKPAPWCPECQAAQYRGEFGLETDEQRLLRHLAEFNEAVADACNGLPDDTPDHVRAMADAINPAPPPFTSYPNHGWVRSPENDVEADDE